MFYCLGDGFCRSSDRSRLTTIAFFPPRHSPKGLKPRDTSKVFCELLKREQFCLLKASYVNLVVLEEALQASVGVDKVADSWHLQDALQSMRAFEMSTIHSVSVCIVMSAETQLHQTVTGFPQQRPQTGCTTCSNAPCRKSNTFKNEGVRLACRPSMFAIPDAKTEAYQSVDVPDQYPHVTALSAALSK